MQGMGDREVGKEGETRTGKGVGVMQGMGDRELVKEGGITAASSVSLGREDRQYGRGPSRGGGDVILIRMAPLASGAMLRQPPRLPTESSPAPT